MMAETSESRLGLGRRNRGLTFKTRWRLDLGNM